MKLVLDRLKAPERDAHILHLAPEQGLSSWLQTVSPQGYEPVDFDPSLYPHVNARKFDLITDCLELPDSQFDLIIHNHVLEHVPINIAHVLHHLHRALKPDGLHVFSIPIIDARYDEYLGRLPKEMAHKRFGQFDHVRLFGGQDIDRHIGSILTLKDKYSLYDYEDAETLDRCNIPEFDRSGFNGSTIFVARRKDYKLWLDS